MITHCILRARARASWGFQLAVVKQLVAVHFHERLHNLRCVGRQSSRAVTSSALINSPRTNASVVYRPIVLRCAVLCRAVLCGSSHPGARERASEKWGGASKTSIFTCSPSFGSFPSQQNRLRCRSTYLWHAMTSSAART